MEKESVTNAPSFKEYSKLYSNNQDFDLLCSIHLSENDHTRILRDILNQKIQGERIFLKSFFDKVLNRECNNEQDYQCKDQITAKGNQDNSKGFVDLFIYSKKLNIIIENKVCGASDTCKQLTRYCQTYCSDTQLKDLKLKASEHHENKEEGAIIFYLTCDGQKEPSTTSIDGKTLGALKNNNWYFPINYEKDILPWLENDVLPNIPYKSDGNMIKGILLYINYLNLLVGRSSSNIPNLWGGCTIRNLYSVLKDAASEKSEEGTNEKTVEDNVLYRRYINSLKTAIDSRLNQIIREVSNREWSAHFAPSYIQLYKNNWSEHFKNRICPIHFELLNYKTNPNWTFHIESSEDDRQNFSKKIEEIKTELSSINTLLNSNLKFNEDFLKTYFENVINLISQSHSLEEFEKNFFKQVPDSSK